MPHSEGRGRRIRIRTGVCLLSLLVLSVGCTEQKSPVGFDRSGRTPPPAAQETLFVSVADTEIRPSRHTAASRSVFVGRDERARAAGLLRFKAIPVIDARMRSAVLKIHLKKGRGGLVTLGLRRIRGDQSAWSATTVLWESRPDTLPDLMGIAADLPGSSIEEGEADSAEFDVDTSLVRFWKEKPDSNAGLQLSWLEGTGILRIVSHNDILYGKAAAIPTPSLVLRDSAGVELARAVATEDAYVIRDERVRPAGTDSIAYISAGTPSRLLLRFDVSGLAPHASIVRAAVRLPLLSMDLPDSLPMRLAAYEVSGGWTEEAAPDSIAIASTAIDLSDTLSSPVELFVTDLVQKWSDGRADPTKNYGLAVRPQDEVSTLESVMAFTHEASAGHRPRLEIVYVRPLDYRWRVK